MYTQTKGTVTHLSPSQGSMTDVVLKTSSPENVNLPQTDMEMRLGAEESLTETGMDKRRVVFIHNEVLLYHEER